MEFTSRLVNAREDPAQDAGVNARGDRFGLKDRRSFPNATGREQTGEPNPFDLQRLINGGVLRAGDAQLGRLVPIGALPELAFESTKKVLDALLSK